MHATGRPLSLAAWRSSLGLLPGGSSGHHTHQQCLLLLRPYSSGLSSLPSSARPLRPNAGGCGVLLSQQQQHFLHATSPAASPRRRNFFTSNVVLQQHGADAAAAAAKPEEAPVPLPTTTTTTTTAAPKRRPARSAGMKTSLRRVAVAQPSSSSRQQQQQQKQHQKQQARSAGSDTAPIAAVSVASGFDMWRAVAALEGAGAGFVLDPDGAGFDETELVHARRSLGKVAAAAGGEERGPREDDDDAAFEDVFVFPSGTLVAWSPLPSALASSSSPPQHQHHPDGVLAEVRRLLVPAAAVDALPAHLAEAEELEWTEDPAREHSGMRAGGDVVVLGTRGSSAVVAAASASEGEGEQLQQGGGGGGGGGGGQGVQHHHHHAAAAAGTTPMTTTTTTTATTTAITNTNTNTTNTGSRLDATLAKIAFSAGLARSTELAVLESALRRYYDGRTRLVPARLSSGLGVPPRRFILQKTGELLALRARLNHYSELTDSLPDLFWDSRGELGLEGYYDQVGRALDVGPRIRALNQKMDYAADMAAVLRELSSERHGTRLEWIIIVLIAVEVAFELRRVYMERHHREGE